MSALNLRWLLVALILALVGPQAFAQAIQQTGPVVSLHQPTWFGNGRQGDAGYASGAGVNGAATAPGVAEGLYVVNPGQGIPPYVNAGSGPYGTNWCDYDAPINNPTGYHFLCIGPNSQGGGLIAYGAGGLASPLPLQFNINGVLYPFPTSSSGNTGRTRLTGATTFYVSASGSDANNCVSPTAVAPGIGPCATRQRVWNLLASLYDLNNQNVTIQVAHGSYTDGFQANGQLVGQNNGPLQVFIYGDDAAANTVVVHPTNNYCFAAVYGAQYSVSGFDCEMDEVLADTISVDAGSTLYFSRAGGNFIFGFNLNPYNDFTVLGNSSVFINGPYSLTKPIVNATSTWSGTVNSITVSGATGTILPYMACLGPGMPLNCYVTSVSGTTIGLSADTSGSESGVTLAFQSGGQLHMDLALSANVFVADSTVVGNARLITVSGCPYYYDGFILVADGGFADIQGLGIATSSSCPFTISSTFGPTANKGGVIDTGQLGAPSLPGTYSLIAVNAITSGNPSISVTSSLALAGMINPAPGQVAQLYQIPINGCVLSNADVTFSAGDVVLTVSSTSGIDAGNAVFGPGIGPGTVVTNVIDGTHVQITTGGTIIGQTNESLLFTGSGVARGSYLTAVSGSGTSWTLTVSPPPFENESSPFNLCIQGAVANGGQFQ